MKFMPVIVALGLVSAAFEGLGIGLVMPMLNAMTGASSGGHGIAGAFLRFGAELPPPRRLIVLAALIVALVLLKNLLAGANAVLSAWVYGKAGHAIRNGLARHLTEVGFRFFSDQNPGRLLNILSTESWRAADAIATGITILTNAAAATILFAFLCLLSWRMTLAVALGLALIQLVQAVASRPLRAGSRVLTQRNGELASRMLHLIDGARLIRIYGQADGERRRFSENSDLVRTTQFRLERRRTSIPPAMEALYVTLFVLVVIGSHRAGVSFSLITAFVVLLYRMQPNFRNLQTASAQLHATSGSLGAIEWLLDPADKPVQPSGALRSLRLDHGIRFENVTFNYSAGASRSAALADISCEFRAGRSTALIGRSGAGKSTIVNLLCRIMEPDSGTIWVDGRALAEFDTAAWRLRLGVASQELELIDASVAENIAYGRPNATRGEIVAAAELADAHEFITRLPGGYDCPVGHRGAELSAGQRQRVALARALVRDPDILILDEATSAMDGISERAIVETLRARAGRSTTIVISHHRKTLMCCDDVVILSAGRVTASAPFAALAEADMEDLYRHEVATSA